MVDTHALGACALRHGGSSPLLGTYILLLLQNNICPCKEYLKSAAATAASWGRRICQQANIGDQVLSNI